MDVRTDGQTDGQKSPMNALMLCLRFATRVNNVIKCRATSLQNLKGQEPEWPNPKLNVGNHLKSSGFSLHY